MKKLIVGVIIAIIIVGSIGVAIATDVIELDDEDDKNKKNGNGDEVNETVVAQITANRTIVRVNENITFDASQSIGNITSYIWDFGDSSSRGNNVSMEHSYSNGGRYLVELTVMSDSGETNSTEIYIGVTYHQDENGTLYEYNPPLPERVNVTVPVQNGSKNMNINLTLTPLLGREVTLDITVYDSNETEILNETHEGVSEEETFLHEIPEIIIYGNYNIELYCREGSTDYDIGIDVNYKDS